MFLKYSGKVNNLNLNPKGVAFGPYFIARPGDIVEVYDTDVPYMMDGNHNIFEIVEHDISPEDIRPENVSAPVVEPLECPVCGKLYKSQKGFERHVETAHSFSDFDKEEVDADAG